MARRIKQGVKAYSSELPEGVTLKWIFSTKSYQLMRGNTVLAKRPIEVVLQWKNPARVFAYIARRTLGKSGAK